jgi:hypothetical protein
MLNPIQRKIAQGVSPLIAFLSEATCGEACWEAREDVCRCSCGGKNHGCLRTPDGVRPVRNAKIDGVRYELKAVGHDVHVEASAINKAAGPRSVDRVTDTLTYTYHWDYTDCGAPARVKKASKQQLAAWPELAAYREQIDAVKADWQHHCWRDIEVLWPDLLWVKV